MPDLQNSSTGIGMYVRSLVVSGTMGMFSFGDVEVSVAQESRITPSARLNEMTVDRPGIAEAPYTVRPKQYQLETGFDFYRRQDADVYFLPTVLFRTGLSSSAELRIGARTIQERRPAGDVRGLSPVTVGIKTHIIEQKGWIPETDILADVIFPTGSSPLQPERTGHDILLLFENDLSEQVAVNYNVGYIWDGFSTDEMFTASACFNYLPSDTWGIFVEYYDFLRKNGTKEHGIDGGFTALLSPLVQVDLSAGISRVIGHWNRFVSAGVSFRVVR